MSEKNKKQLYDFLIAIGIIIVIVGGIAFAKVKAKANAIENKYQIISSTLVEQDKKSYAKIINDKPAYKQTIKGKQYVGYMTNKPSVNNDEDPSSVLVLIYKKNAKIPKKNTVISYDYHDPYQVLKTKHENKIETFYVKPNFKHPVNSFVTRDQLKENKADPNTKTIKDKTPIEYVSNSQELNQSKKWKKLNKLD